MREAYPNELYYNSRIGYQNELYHHGILGQKWGKKNGPPYPLDYSDHSATEKKHLKKELKGYKKLYKKADKIEKKNRRVEWRNYDAKGVNAAEEARRQFLENDLAVQRFASEIKDKAGNAAALRDAMIENDIRLDDAYARSILRENGVLTFKTDASLEQEISNCKNVSNILNKMALDPDIAAQKETEEFVRSHFGDTLSKIKNGDDMFFTLVHDVKSIAEKKSEIEGDLYKDRIERRLSDGLVENQKQWQSLRDKVSNAPKTTEKVAQDRFNALKKEAEKSDKERETKTPSGFMSSKVWQGFLRDPIIRELYVKRNELLDDDPDEHYSELNEVYDLIARRASQYFGSKSDKSQAIMDFVEDMDWLTDKEYDVSLNPYYNDRSWLRWH